MGFYLRKSVSLGPLRLNFSGSGVGASIGVKGLRFGVGPSGTYVHAGAGGLYYRSSLSPPRAGQPAATPQVESRLQRELAMAHPSKWEEIDSGRADLMVDSSAEGVIEQLKRRNDGTYWLPILGIAGLAFTLIAANQGRLFASKIAWTTPTIVWAVVTGLALVATLVGVVWGYRRDTMSRGGVAFLYDLDEEIAAAYERVYTALEKIGSASVRYHVTSSARVDAGRTKYHAGVGTLIKTHALHVDLNAPNRVTANLPIPSVPAGNERLCFFPERLIVLQGSGKAEQIGAIPYRDLEVQVQATTFTLDSVIAPSGTSLVGHTWQYVNKKGGPDKRFKDNRQLAQIASENVVFRSGNGLNEMVMHSSPGIGRELVGAVGQLSELLARSSAKAVVRTPSQAAVAAE